MLTCANCKTDNADSARFCFNCGSALESARPIEGERKYATVLFADVARSTAIAEQLDPEDWALIMNGAFAFMNAAVSRYGGTVSRLMGDAVLALFGAPVTREDDAERAVRAALEIQEEATSYARKVRERYGVDFGLRVGINSGTAVLAFVGDAIKTEYTAMGDAANIAARLQSSAEPGMVLISADTHRLVHGYFDFKPRGAIEMKGKQATVEAYEVLAARAVPGKTRGVEGLASPLVGRDEEISLMREKLNALGAGTGSVIAVLGEAGLGKSRLVEEARDSLDAGASSKPAWFESRAISFGQSIPYLPWRQVGRQMVGATEMDSVATVREKLHAFAGRLSLPPADLPFLETMLAVDSEASRFALADLPGEAVVNGVANAVVAAVHASIKSPDGVRAHVIVMDDLHWSDRSTLELIAHVAALAGAVPLLMICIMRPDKKAESWRLLERLSDSIPGSFSRLDLEPLDSSASVELLGNLLHIEDLPASIRTQILQRADGNPFFLEEVLRSLIDYGQIVREGSRWRATRDIVDAKIPETLAGVLSARIDRLDDQAKRVAQTAAVIGRNFRHRVLERVCRAAPPQERIQLVEPAISKLQFEQLVLEETRYPEQEYKFKHAMTCEAAYGLLLHSRRRELHARTGKVLEELYADRRDEFAGVLARHFAEADDLRHAADYSTRAANSARKLYALSEELEHRERAMTSLERMSDPSSTELVNATIAWTVVRNKLNMYDGVLDRLARAVELARVAGDKRGLAEALSWTGNIHMVTGYPSRSAPYLLESRSLAEELGDEHLLLLPLFAATVHLVDRDPTAAVGQLTEVIELARKHHAPDVQGHAMAFRAIALARTGRFDDARAQILEALELAPRAGSPVKVADLHIAAAMAYYDLGEIEQGLEHAKIGAELAYSANGLECACAGYYAMGMGYLERRRLTEALATFGTSLDLANREGFDDFENLIRGGVAVAEFEQGAPAAIDKLRVAIKNAESGHDQHGAATLGVQFVRALQKVGRAAEGEAILASSIAYFRSRQMLPYLAGALEVAANVHEQTGRVDEAARASEEAAALRVSMRSSGKREVKDPVGRT